MPLPVEPVSPLIVTRCLAVSPSRKVSCTGLTVAAGDEGVVEVRSVVGGGNGLDDESLLAEAFRFLIVVTRFLPLVPDCPSKDRCLAMPPISLRQVSRLS